MSRNGSPDFNPAAAKDRNGASRQRFTLALDLANSSEKRSRIASLSDLALNDLNSPRTDDREKAVLQTPTPTQFLFPKNVTEEQEAYAHGFERALEEIYKEKGPPLALTVQPDDPATRDTQGDTLGSGRDTMKVSIISEATSTATPLPLQVSAPMASRGQFSQCVSQASCGNASVSSNIVNNNNSSNVLANFNFATNLAASYASCTLSQPYPSVCRSQQFVLDSKAPQTEEMSYTGSAPCGQRTVPMPFHSSVMDRHVTASGGTVNWPAHRLTNASNGTFPQNQAQTGTIPQICAQSGIIPRFQAQTGTVPSNYSNAGTVLHSQSGKFPGNNDQAGTVPLMYSQAGVIHPIHSQAETLAPVQSQTGTMVPLHSTGSMLPMHSQTGIMAPAHLQRGTMVPMYSQAGTLLPVHSQTGTAVPIQPHVGFHGFDAQRTFTPLLDSSSLPGSSIYHGMGSDLATNLSWSGLASAGTEPGQTWPSVKSEVQPVGVVNMDEQERMKLERKRAKNRVAAQRCQMRKLERIARLEDKAEKLREQNSKLLQTVDALRGHIAQLKKQITAHANKGCRLLLPDVSTSVTSIVGSL